METAHITPLDGERPAQYAERVGKGYAEASIQKDKKNKGQFFTPLVISEFMGRQANPSEKKRGFNSGSWLRTSYSVLRFN